VKEKHTRFNLRRLKARIKLKGLDAIDRRTGAAKALVEWREGVIAALGGSENISPMKLAVVEEATRTAAYLNHVDEFLLSLDSVIDRRSKKLRSIVEQRMRIGEHLMRQLDRLGLERQAKALSAAFEVAWKQETQNESQTANGISDENPEIESEAQSNSGG
jgi:hypothetical protein